MRTGLGGTIVCLGMSLHLFIGQSAPAATIPAVPCGSDTIATDAFLAQAYVVGDLNGDGHVDPADLSILSSTWTKSLNDPGFNPEADFNCDGTINIVDLLALAGHWGM